MNYYKPYLTYEIVEYKGFGVMEDRIVEVFRKEFKTLEEALEFLDGYRKDKNMSWANWETPYTYTIYKKEVTYTSVKID